MAFKVDDVTMHSGLMQGGAAEPVWPGGARRGGQPALYSIDLNERSAAEAGASEIFRILAQVCL